jgi:hypothetical protein
LDGTGPALFSDGRKEAGFFGGRAALLAGSEALKKKLRRKVL